MEKRVVGPRWRLVSASSPRGCLDNERYAPKTSETSCARCMGMHDLD